MIEEYFLILSQVFLMKRFHFGQLVVPVQELVFSLAHLMEGKELHPLKTCIQEEGGNTLCIGKVCIEARDYGYPRQNGKTLLLCPPKIPENKFIPCAGPFFDSLRRSLFCASRSQSALHRRAAGRKGVQVGERPLRSHSRWSRSPCGSLPL